MRGLNALLPPPPHGDLYRIIPRGGSFLGARQSLQYPEYVDRDLAKARSVDSQKIEREDS